MNEKTQIGRRLKDFAILHYKSVAELERVLGMPMNSLSQYVSGRTGIGSKLQSRLKELGADVDYILTGRLAAEPPKDTIIRFYAKEPPSAEQLARMQRIVQMMVDHPDANNELLEKLAKDILNDGK